VIACRETEHRRRAPYKDMYHLGVLQSHKVAKEDGIRMVLEYYGLSEMNEQTNQYTTPQVPLQYADNRKTKWKIAG
jgi:hypothetical protein